MLLVRRPDHASCFLAAPLRQPRTPFCFYRLTTPAGMTRPKTDILSEAEQTYTLVIHESVWIRQWITALSDVRRFLITRRPSKTACVLSRFPRVRADVGPTVMRTP